MAVGRSRKAATGFIRDFQEFALKGNVMDARFKRKEEMAPPAPTEKECPYCLEKVPLAATRCRACTSDIATQSPIL